MTTVGVVGAGQLARMLALAGIPLGLRFVFLDPAPDACAAALGQHLCRDFDDIAALDDLASRCDVVTYEFENIPAPAMAHLAARVPVFPDPRALAVSHDRLSEKRMFQDLGIPVPAFAPVDSREALAAAIQALGVPAVLKTRTLGYDGKGQFVIRSQTDIDRAWNLLGGVPLILEAFVAFQREVSVIGVRGRDGSTAFYPLAENVHRDGILRTSHSRVDDPVAGRAQAFAGLLLERLDYVGVLALELFCDTDRLLANEMAPRVHNSGHWSIEGAETSQFENHVRAVTGLPIGSTAPLGHVAMVNFIGNLPPVSEVAAIPGAHLHLYDKAPRAGRKIGHATVRTSIAADLASRMQRLLALVQRQA